MAKMDRVSVRAYAKVNFTLDILGREGEFHLLDSLVSTVSLYDRVTAVRREDGALSVDFRGAEALGSVPPESNASRAARAFMQAFSAGGADVRIERHIPAGGHSKEITQ